MTQLATDDFNRANSGTLGANWTNVGQFDLAIVSNACHGNASGDSANSYTGVGAVNVDQWAQCTTVNAQNDGGPTVRGTAVSNTTFYLSDTQNLGTIDIYKCISGAFTLISSISGTWAAGDIAYIEVRGSQIIAKQNGVTRHNFSNTAIDGTTVGGHYPGLFIALANGLILDNFAMGDFSSNIASAKRITFIARNRAACW